MSKPLDNPEISKTEALRQRVKLLREIDYRRAEESLYHFVKAAFAILEPGKTFVDGWHLRYLCEHLELLAEGTIRRLIINIPPRHMKTLIVSVCFPVWAWLRWPESRWIFSSYSSELSTEHSQKRRNLIRSDWFQFRWAKRLQLKPDENRKQMIENQALGNFLATSTGGTVAGKGGDFVCADDPQDPQRGESKVDRISANDHVNYLVNTRLNDPKKSRFVLVMQRIHHEDATQAIQEFQRGMDPELLNEVGSFHVICLPAVAKEETRYIMPKTGEIVDVAPGDILWPNRFTPAILQSIRLGLGAQAYGAQYDQDPTPPGGNLVQADWFPRLSVFPVAKRRVLSFDTATKAGEQNDPTVGAVIRECENLFIIERIYRKRILAADLENYIADLYAKEKPDFVLIEDKDSGQRVIQYFRSHKNIPVYGFKPSPYGDKVQRLSRVSPHFEAKKVALPDNTVLEASWIADFLEEITRFPRAPHDDQVDAVTQALIFLIYEKVVGSFVERPAREQKRMMPGLKEGNPW